ncbi:hypothetical protein Pmani_039296 [Petrolisthes manimaculis]|uniref:Uncharacterized protein n=1 Tax=Petrolisthes manimaculis TaxID=1843537 RepID=A0AAE1NCY7_9EUCA|nr:hypothetical protein Pmani_039296 [Petrolisthes manimaculis]
MRAALPRVGHGLVGTRHRNADPRSPSEYHTATRYPAYPSCCHIPNLAHTFCPALLYFTPRPCCPYSPALLYTLSLLSYLSMLSLLPCLFYTTTLLSCPSMLSLLSCSLHTSCFPAPSSHPSLLSYPLLSCLPPARPFHAVIIFLLPPLPCCPPIATTLLPLLPLPCYIPPTTPLTASRHAIGILT